MSRELELSILTPDRIFFKGEIGNIKTETIDGGIEVLKNHMALITVLQPSITTFKGLDGVSYNAFLSSGILEVKDNELKIICESADWPEEIDARRAEDAKKRAEDRLMKKKESTDVRRAELALQKAILRLKLK